MKNLFVSYEIAVELKEKGFNEPCLAFYENKNIQFEYDVAYSEKFPIKQHLWQLAPLYQQVEEWLFKEYNIFIEIKRLKVMADPNDDLYVYYCEIGNFSSQHYKTPTQALKKGIEKAIKLI